MCSECVYVTDTQQQPLYPMVNLYKCGPFAKIINAFKINHNAVYLDSLLFVRHVTASKYNSQWQAMTMTTTIYLISVAVLNCLINKCMATPVFPTQISLCHPTLKREKKRSTYNIYKSTNRATKQPNLKCLFRLSSTSQTHMGLSCAHTHTHILVCMFRTNCFAPFILLSCPHCQYIFKFRTHIYFRFMCKSKRERREERRERDRFDGPEIISMIELVVLRRTHTHITLKDCAHFCYNNRAIE